MNRVGVGMCQGFMRLGCDLVYGSLCDIEFEFRCVVFVALETDVVGSGCS